MKGFAYIAVSALIIEATWEILKNIAPNHELANKIGPLVLGVIFTVVTNQDLLAVVGIESSVWIFGPIVTGILASRGSGFIHDLLDKMNDILQVE